MSFLVEVVVDLGMDGGEHQAKAVPPKPHRFVASVDAAFVQKIFGVSKRQWKPLDSFTTSRMISGPVAKYREGDRFVI